jgi:hypothetical protein
MSYKKYYKNKKEAFLDLVKIYVPEFNLNSDNNYSFNDDFSCNISKNNNVNIVANYESIGYYDSKNSIWNWIWNIFYVNKKSYSNLLNLKNDSYNLSDHLSDKLKKDNFIIDIRELKDFLKLLLWKLKGDFYIVIKKDEYLHEIIIIKNIKRINF